MPGLPKIERGQGIGAGLLNAVQDALLTRVTGGRGVNVKRTGNQIVIEKARERIIPTRNFSIIVSGGQSSTWDGNDGSTASVFRMNKSGVVWDWDAGAFAHNRVNNGRVYAFAITSGRNNTWEGAGGTYANVWRLDPDDGSVLWSWDGVSVTNMIIGPSGEVYCSGVRNNTWEGNDGSYATLWRLDPADGSVLWDWDGALSRGFVVDDSGNVYVGGGRSSTWEGAGGKNANAFRLNASDGTVTWSWDTGSSAGAGSTIMHVDSAGKVFVRSDWRNTDWEDTDASAANMFRLDPSNGDVLWDWDSGWDTTGFTDFYLDGADRLYLSGQRNSSWEGNDGSNADLWRLDPSDGSVLWDWDSGDTSSTARLTMASSADILIAAIPANAVWEGNDGSTSNTFRINVDTGVVVWDWYTGASGGTSYFVGGALVTSTTRNNTWEGNDGSYATVWRLNVSDGTALWDWDGNTGVRATPMLLQTEDDISSGLFTSAGTKNNAWEGNDGNDSDIWWHSKESGVVLWDRKMNDDALTLILNEL